MSEQYASGWRNPVSPVPPAGATWERSHQVQAGAEARLAVCDETRDVSGTQDDKKKTTISPENECLIVLVYFSIFKSLCAPRGHEHKKGGVWGKKTKKTRPGETANTTNSRITHPPPGPRTRTPRN